MSSQNRSCDPSRNYGCYPTLSPLTAGQLGNLVPCNHCGGVEFLIRDPDWTTVCKKCGQVLSTAVGSNALKSANSQKLQIQYGLDHLIVLNKTGGIWAYPEYEDTTPISAESWPRIVSIASAEDLLVGLRSDGRLLFECSEPDEAFQALEHVLRNWSDVADIAAADHIVGLFQDGTVRATGDNDYGQCRVQNWRNITAIAVGWDHTVGLRTDGTVQAVGKNDKNQCDVSQWTNVTAIDAASSHTIALCSDGTVRATGDNEDGQCDIQSWSNILAISTESYFTVGLRKDGTVLTTRNNYYSQHNVQQWSDVVEIATTHSAIIGIQRDGTVLCTDSNLLEKLKVALT